MGRNRKKSGAGAVAQTINNNILAGEYDGSPEHVRTMASYLLEAPITALERAFNRSEVRDNFNFVFDEAVRDGRDAYDDFRRFDPTTGDVSDSEQDVFDSFIESLQAARRDDGTWSIEELRSLATIPANAWADDYGERRFRNSEAEDTIETIQSEIKVALASAAALGNVGIPYRMDDETLVFPNGNRVNIRPIADAMYPTTK